MVNKSCDTCEFNFGGICASGGEMNYGEKILDYKKQRSCWEISFNYSIDLAGKLPHLERDYYEHDTRLTPSHLIYRLENGHWSYENRKFHLDEKGKWILLEG